MKFGAPEGKTLNCFHTALNLWLKIQEHHTYLTLSLYDIVAPQADKTSEYERQTVRRSLYALIGVLPGSH
jgi:hypothetical protein